MPSQVSVHSEPIAIPLMGKSNKILPSWSFAVYIEQEFSFVSKLAIGLKK